MAELEKHEKFDLRLNSQVKQVTHAPGNVTATFQNLKTRETDSVSGTVVSSYVNSNRRCYHRRRKGKGRRCSLGEEIHSFPCRTTDLAPGWVEEYRINRRTSARQNGCFGKMDGHLVHTTPNPPPSQKGCSSKNFSSNHPCC